MGCQMVKPVREPSDIVQLKVRMREQLRARLEQEANHKRVSLNFEIVARLEGTFARELLGWDEYAEPDIRQAMQTFGRTLASLEHLTGRKAFGPDGDPWLHRQVEKVFGAWLEATRPIANHTGAAPRLPDGRIAADDFGATLMNERMRQINGPPMQSAREDENS